MSFVADDIYTLVRKKFDPELSIFITTKLYFIIYRTNTGTNFALKLMLTRQHKNEYEKKENQTGKDGTFQRDSLIKKRESTL